MSNPSEQGILDSLPAGYRAAVFGAHGGLGGAFIDALCADPRCARVYGGARLGAVGHDIANPSAKVHSFSFDLDDESSIESAALTCTSDGPLHLVLVATGMLHDGARGPEKTWRACTAAAFDKAFAVNAIGPALIAKHLLGHLATRQKAVFAVLSARVGSIADNRLGGWHAYRASKAALNMLIRTFSIELAVVNKSAVCIALHPGTVDTALSRPFRAAIPLDTLFTTQRSVAHLLNVIDRVIPAQTGKLLAWDGAEIPF